MHFARYYMFITCFTRHLRRHYAQYYAYAHITHNCTVYCASKKPVGPSYLQCGDCSCVEMSHRSARLGSCWLGKFGCRNNTSLAYSYRFSCCRLTLSRSPLHIFKIGQVASDGHLCGLIITWICTTPHNVCPVDYQSFWVKHLLYSAFAGKFSCREIGTGC